MDIPVKEPATRLQSGKMRTKGIANRTKSQQTGAMLVV